MIFYRVLTMYIVALPSFSLIHWTQLSTALVIFYFTFMIQIPPAVTTLSATQTAAAATTLPATTGTAMATAAAPTGNILYIVIFRKLRNLRFCNFRETVRFLLVIKVQLQFKLNNCVSFTDVLVFKSYSSVAAEHVKEPLYLENEVVSYIACSVCHINRNCYFCCYDGNDLCWHY